MSPVKFGGLVRMMEVGSRWLLLRDWRGGCKGRFLSQNSAALASLSVALFVGLRS